MAKNTIRITESTLKRVITKTVMNLLRENSDDDMFWENEREDELAYDMAMLQKAAQQANGTYTKTSSDGSFSVGDKVVIHTKARGDIEGVIKDIDVNDFTFKEVADVDYWNEEHGRTFTMVGCPLTSLEKVQGNVNEARLKARITESVRHMIQEGVPQMAVMSKILEPEQVYPYVYVTGVDFNIGGESGTVHISLDGTDEYDEGDAYATDFQFDLDAFDAMVNNKYEGDRLSPDSDEVADRCVRLYTQFDQPEADLAVKKYIIQQFIEQFKYMIY